MFSTRDNTFDLILNEIDESSNSLADADLSGFEFNIPYVPANYCDEPSLPPPFAPYIPIVNKSAIPEATTPIINPPPFVTHQPTETHSESSVSTRRSTRLQTKTHRWSDLLDNSDQPDAENIKKKSKAAEDDNDEYTPLSSSTLSYKLLQKASAKEHSNMINGKLPTDAREYRDLKYFHYKAKKKKKAENFNKGIKIPKYKCRQDVAKARVRVKGRFMSKTAELKIKSEEKHESSQQQDFSPCMRMK
ncbi:MAG: CCT domain-containing protein [Gammaproteobacteria bacterium]